MTKNESRKTNISKRMTKKRKPKNKLAETNIENEAARK
jgi:hypothetical protein